MEDRQILIGPKLGPELAHIMAALDGGKLKEAAKAEGVSERDYVIGQLLKGLVRKPSMVARLREEQTLAGTPYYAVATLLRDVECTSWEKFKGLVARRFPQYQRVEKRLLTVGGLPWLVPFELGGVRVYKRRKVRAGDKVEVAVQPSVVLEGELEALRREVSELKKMLVEHQHGPNGWAGMGFRPFTLSE